MMILQLKHKSVAGKGPNAIKQVGCRQSGGYP